MSGIKLIKDNRIANGEKYDEYEWENARGTINIAIRKKARPPKTHPSITLLLMTILSYCWVARHWSPGVKDSKWVRQNPE